ncbi:acyl-CoA thioesterase [Jejudonia soesokkakensis]|uniref:Acyl-CoA thioesterase n=1 Tax=Jejudonia soesokkakensis TaxID=1323432 RepID=A0ABW2MVA3_9FLAO
MEAEIFNLEITVSEKHIDAQNHVNNLVYLEWCLAAAEAHWEKNTSEAIRKQYIWYVLNHNISYKAAAFLGEKLEVQTWVSNTSGVKSERSYSIRRKTDNQLLIEAKTLWCLIDAESVKPVLIPEEIRTLFL